MSCFSYAAQRGCRVYVEFQAYLAYPKIALTCHPRCDARGDSIHRSVLCLARYRTLQACFGGPIVRRVLHSQRVTAFYSVFADTAAPLLSRLPYLFPLLVTDRSTGAATWHWREQDLSVQLLLFMSSAFVTTWRDPKDGPSIAKKRGIQGRGRD